jgi:pyridoxamine 5'-phosphate oxidase family protein
MSAFTDRELGYLGERRPARLGRLASVDPWQPRGIEIRGRAEAIEADRALIRIHPERIVSWGIKHPEVGRRHSRDVTVTQE